MMLGNWCKKTAQTILGVNGISLYNNQGEILSYKFVAKGYTQIKSAEFKETFFHAVKMTTPRLILAMAAAYSYEYRQLEVKTAYPNAPLEEDVFL